LNGNGTTDFMSVMPQTAPEYEFLQKIQKKVCVIRFFVLK